jgi:DNA-binding transcriptional MerR regulator
MIRGSTISEVADQTGFTASALRYYERVGLVTPSRTESGYRVYDDRTVDRLRFISRSKQLGLTLEEITELVQLWDGNECAPVADRLSTFVDDKIRQAQNRIAQLQDFVQALEAVRDRLSEPSAGPCDEECACQVTARRAPEPIALTAKAQSSEQPPIACTLASDAVAARMTKWRELTAQATSYTTSQTESRTSRTMRFPPSHPLAAQVGILAAAEQSCCAFFEFTVKIDHTRTELTISAPKEAAPLINALVGTTQ